MIQILKLNHRHLKNSTNNLLYNKKINISIIKFFGMFIEGKNHQPSDGIKGKKASDVEGKLSEVDTTAASDVKGKVSEVEGAAFKVDGTAQQEENEVTTGQRFKICRQS